MMKNDVLTSYLDSLYPTTSCFLNHSKDYELLIAIILSAQTTDKKVNAVTDILFKRYDSLEKLKNASYSDIYKIIAPLGLAKNKTTYILKACKKLDEEFDGKVPDSKEKLLSIPGVGNKTAKVILGELFNKVVIPVDTHIKRIANRLELSKSSDPDVISKDLEKKFKGSSIQFHRKLILFGRNICKAISPLCSECKLSKYCKYYKEHKKIGS